MASRYLAVLTAAAVTVAAAVVPAAASAAPATAVPQARPKQPASPRSGDRIVLGPANGKVTMLAGPVSVPAGTGPYRNASFTSFDLTDRVKLQVNYGSGNLLLRTTELTLPGLSGNVGIGSVYNSLFVGSDIQKGFKATLARDGAGWSSPTTAPG